MQQNLHTEGNFAASVCNDIAPNYPDWRDLGFALADALGESGRTYYHRLSRFYSGYTEKETDKQYNKCLKAHGHGVTIKTLYHLAKAANIDISILPNIQNGNLAKVAKYPSPQIVKYPK
jgi:broad specificity phosphatase PhoE